MLLYREKHPDEFPDESPKVKEMDKDWIGTVAKGPTP
jgi:hypothetical protein